MAKLMLNDVKKFYNAQQPARFDSCFLTDVDMMREIRQVGKVLHVIPTFPEHLL